MEVNADFAQLAAVRAAQCNWIKFSLSRVVRQMLDRIGDEVARTTLIVRYEPGSYFSPHIHSGREKLIVPLSQAVTTDGKRAGT